MSVRETHGGMDAARRRAAVARPVAALVAALVAAAASGLPARADGLWDSVLEGMNVKAAPAAPGPDFVERSRPDPADLGYLPTASPHKVSPLAVKTPAQIQAEKDALDLAKARQLDPNAGRPAPLAKAAAGRPAGASDPSRSTKPIKPAKAPRTAEAARATPASAPPVGD